MNKQIRKIALLENASRQCGKNFLWKMRCTMASMLLGLSCSALMAQTTVSDVLAAIDKNNTTLRALRQEAEAEKLANRQGNALADPEVEFGYLWGTPSGTGTRTDVSVTQTFDLSTVLGFRARATRRQNAAVDLRLKAERMEVLLEAEQLCIALAHDNALLAEYDKRLANAEALVEAYSRKFAAGDANALENNKAQLNLVTVQGNRQRLIAEHAANLARLAMLNGGDSLAFDATELSPAKVPVSFEAWYAEAEQLNPLLAYVQAEAEAAEAQVGLSRSQWLPRLSAGYMSEKTTAEHYQGLTVGVSVPLWGSARVVRQAQADQRAAIGRQVDAKAQFLGALRVQYARVIGLEQTAAQYRAALTSANSADLLEHALEVGHISLLNYLLEMGIYYDVAEQALDAERDFRLALAELRAVEL